MNTMRGMPDATDVRNHNQPSSQLLTSRRAVGGTVAFLLLLLSMLLPAAPASAVVSPNKFVLQKQSISVIPPSSDEAVFNGTVTMQLNLSNEGPDVIKMRVSGNLVLNEPGCAKLRVSYLDAAKNLVPGRVEHSETLTWPAQVEKVYESSFHPDYRQVRLEVLYGSTCSDLAPIGQKTTYLSAQMSTLGRGERWVSGVDYDDASLTYNGGTAHKIVVRWDAVTNPAPTPDRGDARITAVLSQSGPGCSRLQARHYDVAGGLLGTTWSEEVCGPVPTEVTLSNFASNADLHRISIRLRHQPLIGQATYSISRDFLLD